VIDRLTALAGGARRLSKRRGRLAVPSGRPAAAERRDADELKRRLDETHERLKRETPPESGQPPS
jgi:hypothetical protein